MSALTFCLLASVLYTFELAVTDRQLPRVSPIALTGLFGICIAASAIPGAITSYRQGELELPRGREWILIAVLGALSFLADWCHFSALHYRAGSAVLATFYLVLPVTCSILLWEPPSLRRVVAWILGGIAILLVSSELWQRPS